MPQHVPNIKLYNKHLAPPGNVCEVPDSIGGRISGETLIRQSAGAWRWAPAPAEPEAGVAAEPVEYEPALKAAKAIGAKAASTKPKEGND